MVCPKCGGSDVSITEEVYQHSNKIFHKLVKIMLVIVGIIIISRGEESIALGIAVIFGSLVYGVVVRMYEHVRSAKSRTKCICLQCKNKWYIG
jgi:4-hydroxy-3-methylbut-2-en-1-yl diphosphate synthase IspG/GcpE